MGATITHSTGTISPAALTGWDSSAEARTIMHPILGRSDDDVSFRPAGLRRGTLTLAFATGAAAYAARAILVTGQVFALAHSAVAQVAMSFVVADGDVGDVLHDAAYWTLSVPFREVLP